MKKFNNRENKEIWKDGKSYWISRSVAVVGIHFAVYEDKIYVLVEKRSKNVDCPEKWCAVCGYLDWDESAYEAVLRETYEETSFDVEKEKSLTFNNNSTPFFVNSSPLNDARQNVTLGYIFIYNYEFSIPVELELYHNHEVDEVKWLDTNYLHTHSMFSSPDSWAFNHDHIIKKCLANYADFLI